MQRVGVVWQLAQNLIEARGVVRTRSDDTESLGEKRRTHCMTVCMNAST